MKLYCQIEQKIKEDGTFMYAVIKGPQELPQNSEHVSNLNLLNDEELKSFGWVPVEQQTENKPVFVSSSYEVFEDKVVERIVTSDKTEEQLLKETEIQTHYQWQEIREQRNRLLAESDKLVMIDRWEALSDEEKTKIKEYRRALRDLPAQYTNPSSINFPVL